MKPTPNLVLYRKLGGIPFRLDPLPAEQALKVTQYRRGVSDFVRTSFLLQRKMGEQAHRFSDSPFHRMQPITAVGDVCGANVLARREKIPHPHGKQRTERNLKWQ